MTLVGNGLGADVTPAFETIAELEAALGPVMRAVAAAVGPHCEVVLHDLSGDRRNLEHTIRAIENGEVTGRRVGGPSTNLALAVLRDESADHNAFGYRGRTDDGRELHCSSIYYRNSSGRIIGALCINVDLTPLQNAQASLAQMIPVADRDMPPQETQSRNLATVLDSLLDASIDAVGKPVSMMDKADRMIVLAHLDQQGAFQIKRSVVTVSRRLGISKVTTYAYLDELRRPAE
ncbi:MAG: transcriptional regulator [Nostocoides sp.]